MENFDDLDITKYVDISEDSHNANAFGQGSVAASGPADVVAATGFKSVAVQNGEVNQADHQSQIFNNSFVGQNQSNSPGAIQAGDSVHGANTGFNSGLVAGG